MRTLSIIKADTGGFVGHPAMHPAMVADAAHAIGRVRGGLLIDGQIATSGDGLAFVMTHEHGVEAEAIHAFAWEVFQTTTATSR